MTTPRFHADDLTLTPFEQSEAADMDKAFVAAVKKIFRQARAIHLPKHWEALGRINREAGKVLERLNRERIGE